MGVTTKLYLDSSVIVKRYVAEEGSEAAARIYEASDAKEMDICFSLWNVGELGIAEQEGLHLTDIEDPKETSGWGTK